MKHIKTVFLFEYFGYIKSKSFIIVTICLVIAAILGSSFPTAKGYYDKYKQSKNAAVDKSDIIAIIDTLGLDEAFAKKFFKNEKIQIINSDTNIDDVLEDLSAGNYKYVVEINDLDYKIYVSDIKISMYEIESIIHNMIKQSHIEKILINNGLDTSQITSVLNINPEGSIITISANKEQSSGEAYMKNAAFSYIMLFLIYFTVILYSQHIAMSIVSEKTSKAMEVLITSVKPTYLMFGKVLGVGMAGLTQFAGLLGIGYISLSINSKFWDKIEVDSAVKSFAEPVPIELIVYLVVFFLLGFFIYAFLNAALASTVSRMEDINNTVMIPMLLIVGSFLVAILGMTNPNALYVKVFSFIPFFAPMVMFMRACLDVATTLEILISIVLLFAGVIVTGFLGAKIYRVGVLMYGKPPNIKQVLIMIFK